MRKYGPAEVHARHYRRVYDMLREHGKTVMMYGDIILANPSILEKIPRDIILFDWHYEVKDSYPSTELLEKSGFRFIVSPGVQNWSRVFPHQTNALANTERLIRDGYECGAIGAVTSAWGDFGGANLRELNYYGYAFAADKAWNVRDRDVGRFEKIFFNVFFGSDDPGLAAVYHNLTSCTQHFKTDYLFGHPFYTRPSDTQDIMSRAYELVSFGEQIGSHLPRLRSSVSRNRDHIDILAWCADMFVWVGYLENIQLDLAGLSTKKHDDTGSRQRTQQLIAELHRRLGSLRERYEKLWLRTNRAQNLHRILSLFQRVETQLKIGEQQIAAGDLSLDGRLTVPFIGLCTSSPQNAGIPRIALRKRFTLDHVPGDAWLQIIADSHGIVSLNEKRVGEVMARRSLSAIVENERVKVWPVTELLRKGDNTLSIEVYNYFPEGNAAANVWLEIPDQRYLITSDSTWKVSDNPPPDWLSSVFDDSRWASAVEVDIPWVISQPHFSCGLSSRIEFFKSLDRI